MQATNWTQPIREEIRQAEAAFVQHKQSMLQYLDIMKSLSITKDYDEYQKIRELVDAESHACGLAEYRIRALRYDMNYDLGYYDNDNDSRYEEEENDDE